MQKVQGNTLFHIAQCLCETQEMCTSAEDHELVNDTVAKMFDIIHSHLETSKLQVSLNISRIAKGMVDSKPRKMTNAWLGQQLAALKEAVYAELQTMLFFQMDETLRKYFEEPNLFGADVAMKFPTASLEIEEAGKCLALGRPTASVFHMIRTMEVGLRALAKNLKIDYAPSWEAYIKKN